MKSYHANKGAGLEGLKLREHEVPEPGPREVLVQVQARSLNFRELMILRGYYPLPIRPDVIPASDGAGLVVAIGSEVTRARVGDRVAGALFPYWIDGPFAWDYSAQLGGSLDGMLTEYALLTEEAVVAIPDALSFAEAATLPCAGVTAWNALTGGQQIHAGDTVLILGSGGVSLFALQFARLLGMHTIVTTSSDEKAQKLKALGADNVINYRNNPNWHEEARELTGGRGVDRVIEVCGPGTIEQSIKATRLSGEISLVGTLAGETSLNSTDLLRALLSNVITLRSVSAGSRAQFMAMNRAVAQHRLKPVVDRTFSFEETHAAFRYYEDGQYFGKIIISSL